MPRAIVQSLAVALAISGLSSARADLFSPYDTWRDDRGVTAHTADSGSDSPDASEAGHWFMPRDEVAHINALMENRRVHNVYSTSHQATLISWASQFNIMAPGAIPSAGSGLDYSHWLDKDPSERPGGRVGPDIPPVPAPGSAALAAVGFALFVCTRRSDATGRLELRTG